MERWKFIDVIKMNCNLGPNCVQNLFHNPSTFLEQPLLPCIIVTGVCSECNIFVCYLCTGNWCIFTMFVMSENTDITSYYVLPVDGHIVVSLCCTVLVIKSQGMQELVYNYPVS
jgi:hypothetical protein